MTLNLGNGYIGQIRGPFSSSDRINFNNHLIKLGVFIGEKDFMAYPPDGFKIQITDTAGTQTIIRLGREGIYELDEVISLGSISFPLGAPASLVIDYAVMDE